MLTSVAVEKHTGLADQLLPSVTGYFLEGPIDRDHGPPRIDDHNSVADGVDCLSELRLEAVEGGLRLVFLVEADAGVDEEHDEDEEEGLPYLGGSVGGWWVSGRVGGWVSGW